MAVATNKTTSNVAAGFLTQDLPNCGQYLTGRREFSLKLSVYTQSIFFGSFFNKLKEPEKSSRVSVMARTQFGFQKAKRLLI